MAREREQIMLCYPFEEKRFQKWLQEVKSIYVQPKYEGDRCRAVLDAKGKCTLFSSSARTIGSVPHVQRALEGLHLTNIELDGELYKHGMPHEEIRSRVSRTVGYHPDYEEIEYHVYDIVSEHVQRTRLMHLPHIVKESEVIKLSPLYEVGQEEGLQPIYDLILEQGYEGIVLRHPMNTYERKRSTKVMKLKPRLSGIYEVIDMQEEFTIQGEPKKSLGALVLKDDDGHTFKVGSGFLRSEREDYWKLNLKGRLCKIRYQAITTLGVPKMASFESFVNTDMYEQE